MRGGSTKINYRSSVILGTINYFARIQKIEKSKFYPSFTEQRASGFQLNKVHQGNWELVIVNVACSVENS